MIKIIDITNCRIYNGVFLTRNDFVVIVKALALSNYAHTVTYFDYKDNKEKAVVLWK